MEENMYNEFEAWLDAALEAELPDDIAAFNFNLYEDGDNLWSIELIGASRFDPEDPDWACDEVTDFNSRDPLFTWQAECEWDEALDTMVDILKKYLNEGKYSDLMKSKNAVGIGFADGDIEIIYISK